MISWHKRGQLVTLRQKYDYWAINKTGPLVKEYPVFGEVYDIAEVHYSQVSCAVFFRLKQLDCKHYFFSGNFRPVRPTSIEELRKLCPPLHTFENSSRPFERV